MPGREELLVGTFVEVADTLVNDFDVVDFLTTLTVRCVELFDTSEAGLMLVDRSGGLRIAASSSGAMNHLELFELQHHEGPCVDCFQSGEPVTCADLEAEIERWPAFGPEALRSGFHSVHALPMRLRDTRIGSLNLLRHEPGPLDPEDLRAMQALADVATIGLLQQRAAEDAKVLADQLQHALNSRVIIEQAKGVLAQSLQVGMDEAFDLLRRYSRDRNRRLSEVAAAVVTGELSARDVAEVARHRSGGAG
jgi:GAF domain-containing protein